MILAAVIVTLHYETVRSRDVKRRMKDFSAAFNLVALEPLEARSDPAEIYSYKETLSRVLVQDYLQSEDIRRIVDADLPRRGTRRDVWPSDSEPENF